MYCDSELTLTINDSLGRAVAYADARVRVRFKPVIEERPDAKVVVNSSGATMLR